MVWSCDMIRKLGRYLLGMALAMGTTGPVVGALTEPRPSGYQLRRDGWTFVPIATPGAGSDEVVGILAMLDKSVAVGDNIVSVLYTPTAGGGWEGKAWETSDQGAIIKYVKSTYGISDTWDWLWPTQDTIGGTMAPSPATYEKGLIVTDPLAFIVQLPSRDSAVEALQAAGYKVADIDFEKEGDCTSTDVLDGITTVVETALLMTNPTQADISNLELVAFPNRCHAVGQGGGGGTIPGTTIPIPPGWTPVNPGRWQRPAQETHPPTYDPTCSTAVSCCYKQKIWFLYYENSFWGLRTKYCKANTRWSCPMPANGACTTSPNCGQPTGPLSPPPGWVQDCGHIFV